jgi:hypothetical protein
MSRAQEFGADLLDRLLQLYKFGPLYLDQHELSGCLNDRQLSYYRLLARRFLAGSSREFWQHHKSGLRTGGRRIENLRLFKHVCVELLRLLANPGFTALLLRDRIRTKTGNKQHTDGARELQPQTGLSPGIPTPRDPR